MKMTIQEAEAAVARVFPGCIASVVDGYKNNEAGVVEDAKGRTIATFRLRMRRQKTKGKIPRVKEIRIGQIGQFCGTTAELKAFQTRRRRK
jgi:hypothetical protein